MIFRLQYAINIWGIDVIKKNMLSNFMVLQSSIDNVVIEEKIF